MASPKPFTAIVKGVENGPEREIQVNTTDREDMNWHIRFEGGDLYFKSKESVKTFLERKFHTVKGVD